MYTYVYINNEIAVKSLPSLRPWKRAHAEKHGPVDKTALPGLKKSMASLVNSNLKCMALKL